MVRPSLVQENFWNSCCICPISFLSGNENNIIIGYWNGDYILSPLFLPTSVWKGPHSTGWKQKLTLWFNQRLFNWIGTAHNWDTSHEYRYLEQDCYGQHKRKSGTSLMKNILFRIFIKLMVTKLMQLPCPDYMPSY